MAKFKLIKKFPGSPEVGTIFTGGSGFCYKERGMDGKKSVSSSLKTYLEKDIENNPEYFAPCLFTTEDGVDIYEGDLFYHIAYENVWLTIAMIQPDYQRYGKTFSTEKAAQDYMDLLKPQYEKGDYVVLSIDNTTYMGIYEGVDKGLDLFVANMWVLFEPGKALCDDVFISTGYFKKVERRMTQHEIFEYLMAKHNVRNEWPIGSKVELINDIGMNASVGASAIIDGYVLLDNELLLNVEWRRPTPSKSNGNSSQKHGGYPIEIFKLIK